MKRVLICMLCLLLTGSLQVAVAAADGPAGALTGLFSPVRDVGGENAAIAMSVRFDYDDQVRAGVVVPAFVQIENSGPALEGTLRLSITPQGNDQANCHAYDLSVNIAEGSSTEYMIPFQVMERRQDIHVQLLVKDSIVAQATKARPRILYSDRLLVGFLGDDVQGIDFRTSLDTLMDSDSSSVRVVSVDLTPEEFPEQYYLLDRFALLVLHHFDLGYLNDTQRNTLEQWVRNGGKLLVDADINNRQAVQSLKTLIDLQVTGELTIPVIDEEMEEGEAEHSTSRNNILQGLGRIEPAGNLLAGSATAPLMMEYPVGRGRVFVTAFSLDGVRELGDTDIADALGQIPGLSARAASYLDTSYVAYGSSYNSSLNDAVKSIPWLDAPSITWVVLVLVLFIVLAGPVSYAVLAKRDKRDWIWVTAPALALVFCVVIVGYGVGKHGRHAVSSVATVVDLRDSTQATQAFSLIGVAAPRQGSYEIGFEEEAFPYRLFERDYYYGYDSDEERPAGTPSTRFDLTGYPRVTYPQIAQWSMETLCLRREIPMEGTLEVQLGYRVDGMRYTVRNSTGYALEDVTIATPLGYERIPLLEQGEERSGTAQLYDSTQTQPYASLYMYTYGSGLDYYYAIRELYGGEQNASLPESERRENYVKTRMMEVLQQSATSYAYESMVWGWSRELGDISITSNGKPVKNELNRAIVIGKAETVYEENDELLIPLGQITGIVVDMQDVANSYLYMDASHASFEEGEVTFRFSLPERVKQYDLDQLLIVPGSSSGIFSTLLYNCVTEQWDTHAFDILLTGNDGQDYIDGDGSVLLKITSETEEENSAAAWNSIYVDNITIGVSGKESPHAGD